MRLVLFRHGIAIDRDDPASPVEEDRFLTERGIERTRAAAAGLRRLGVSPNRILSSPWLRARQTAEIAAQRLHFDPARIELSESLLPFAPVSALVAQVIASREVLVTGHAPHLDEVVEELTGARAARLKKAGAACIEVHDTSPGSGQLEWLLPARALRELGRSRG